MSQVINRVVSWLRADCPTGVPPTDHVALVALLMKDLPPNEAGPSASGPATS